MAAAVDPSKHVPRRGRASAPLVDRRCGAVGGRGRLRPGAGGVERGGLRVAGVRSLAVSQERARSSGRLSRESSSIGNPQQFPVEAGASAARRLWTGRGRKMQGRLLRRAVCACYGCARCARAANRLMGAGAWSARRDQFLTHRPVAPPSRAEGYEHSSRSHVWPRVARMLFGFGQGPPRLQRPCAGGHESQ